MLDIIKCSSEDAHGFARLCNYDAVKPNIIQIEKTSDSSECRNKKKLILLKDYQFDDGAVKLVAEKKKACYLIDLSRLFGNKGFARARAIAMLRNFLKLCVKHNAYYTFASFAEKEFEIRAPHEIENICYILGLNAGQTKFALKMLKHYV